MKLHDALQGLRDESTTYEDVKAAVAEHEFTVPKAAKSLDELVDLWDYAPDVNSFRDTVEKAMWQKLLTREQTAELRAIAFPKEEKAKE